jgi:hypothetical protein
VAHPPKASGAGVRTTDIHVYNFDGTVLETFSDAEGLSADWDADNKWISIFDPAVPQKRHVYSGLPFKIVESGADPDAR